MHAEAHAGIIAVVRVAEAQHVATLHRPAVELGVSLEVLAKSSSLNCTTKCSAGKPWLCLLFLNDASGDEAWACPAA